MEQNSRNKIHGTLIPKKNLVKITRLDFKRKENICPRKSMLETMMLLKMSKCTLKDLRCREKQFQRQGLVCRKFIFLGKFIQTLQPQDGVHFVTEHGLFVT